MAPCQRVKKPLKGRILTLRPISNWKERRRIMLPQQGAQILLATSLDEVALVELHNPPRTRSAFWPQPINIY